MKILSSILLILWTFTFLSCENSGRKDEAYSFFKKNAREDNIENAISWAKDVIKYAPESQEAKEAKAYIDDKSKVLKANSLKKNIEATEAKLLKQENQEKLKLVLKRFRKSEDEFNEKITYTPISYSKYWPRRLVLQTYVDEEGDVALFSNYFSEDWIFHTSIMAKVDGETYSASVGDFSNNEIQEVADGGVYERNRYSDNSDIVKAIAKAKNNSVKIRFEGRQFYRDATLNSGDIKAIRDCYELSTLLKSVK